LIWKTKTKQKNSRIVNIQNVVSFSRHTRSPPSEVSLEKQEALIENRRMLSALLSEHEAHLAKNRLFKERLHKQFKAN